MNMVSPLAGFLQQQALLVKSKIATDNASSHSQPRRQDIALLRRQKSGRRWKTQTEPPKDQPSMPRRRISLEQKQSPRMPKRRSSSADDLSVSTMSLKQVLGITVASPRMPKRRSSSNEIDEETLAILEDLANATSTTEATGPSTRRSSRRAAATTMQQIPELE